ncbi:hypothetical protein D3C81_2268610 [compost metagenome]
MNNDIPRNVIRIPDAALVLFSCNGNSVPQFVVIIFRVHGVVKMGDLVSDGQQL